MLHFIHSYGLLGSSGCGKTTLLTSLTGFSSLDYGSIHIDIQSPSRLGFMPQEIALFEEFSIAETFSFFAKLYNIAPETYQATIKELKTVLDLPPDNQLCSTLRILLFTVVARHGASPLQ
uniref:ABC transporter G family member 23 n=1 Tax=Cacopsylla melanoneura TaxID=428564 RepID=A0A8D8X9F2_9HEMI